MLDALLPAVAIVQDAVGADAITAERVWSGPAGRGTGRARGQRMG